MLPYFLFLFRCMLLSMISMLFIYYLFVSIAKMGSKITSICELAGFVIQYSQMSTFFWLSAIGFNVWKSFRKMEDPSRSQTRGKLAIYDKRYKWYALYAWGLPSVVTLVTLIMQHLPKDQRHEKIYYPKIGDPICSLELKHAQFFYSYIIIGPLLVTLWYLHFQIIHMPRLSLFPSGCHIWILRKYCLDYGLRSFFKNSIHATSEKNEACYENVHCHGS